MHSKVVERSRKFLLFVFDSYLVERDVKKNSPQIVWISDTRIILIYKKLVIYQPLKSSAYISFCLICLKRKKEFETYNHYFFV